MGYYNNMYVPTLSLSDPSIQLTEPNQIIRLRDDTMGLIYSNLLNSNLIYSDNLQFNQVFLAYFGPITICNRIERLFDINIIDK